MKEIYFRGKYVLGNGKWPCDYRDYCKLVKFVKRIGIDYDWYEDGNLMDHVLQHIMDNYLGDKDELSKELQHVLDFLEYKYKIRLSDVSNETRDLFSRYDALIPDE